jgi:hypothetical protein
MSEQQIDGQAGVRASAATDSGELSALIRRLAAGYDGQYPAGVVVGCVRGCAEELLRAGVRSGLIPATEAMARARLNRLQLSGA